MQTQVSSATDNPAPFVKAKDRHYVKVEKADLHNYLYQASETKSADAKYKVESEMYQHTGHPDLVLISCSAKDYQEHQKQIRRDSVDKEIAKGGAEDKIDSPRLIS